MRNLKKFLALVMAMVMAFSLMLSASAANPVKTFGDADQITEAFVEAADVLTGMKVFQGDEGGFRPGDNITRAEVAALIYRLATGDTGTEKMDLYTTTHPFTDVGADDWFAGYVGYCWNAGYIKGTTATTFNPYDSVTGYETLAMVLRAMGYDKNNEFTGAQWIVNVSATDHPLRQHPAPGLPPGRGGQHPVPGRSEDPGGLHPRLRLSVRRPHHQHEYR